MRRHIFLLTVLFTVALGALSFIGMRGQASLRKRSKAASTSPAVTQKGAGGLTISVTPLGPTQEDIDAAIRAVRTHPTGVALFGKNNIRQLAMEFPDRPPRSLRDPYRVTFFDYTNNRAIVAAGTFGNTTNISYTQPKAQPQPSEEEFAAAVEILRGDPAWAEVLKDDTIKLLPPMPPLAREELGLSAERTLHVGLRSSAPNVPNQIVGVNMIRGTIVTYPNNAPPTALANPDACGVPGAGQSTTPRNTAGQYEMIVAQAGTELWRMTVVRPSVSSGTRASGVELRNVLYRGKTLFKRAHVPILNVRYNGNACGPYRDWQYQEGQLVCNAGTDVAPGFRVCAAPPQTILENDTDVGNHRGVAVYQDGNEAVLVSELEAGWYRYVSRWRFRTDGTLLPEFGFDGVDNSCVCNIHYHHVFWRFDIDVASAGKNLITQFDTPQFGAPLITEGKAWRDYTRGRYWVIENQNTGEAFKLEPGAHDSTAFGDTYGRYDLVFLRYQLGTTNFTSQYDDGINTTGPNNTEANLDQFINGESLEGQDVVIWYGAHFTHTNAMRNGPEADGNHVTGPRFVPLRW